MEKLLKCKELAQSYLNSLLIGSAVLITAIAVVASVHASIVMALALVAVSLIMYILYTRR